MYGYLKWNRGRRKSKLANTYKCYYCGLCNAMKKNYGILSLFFLSNDITLIVIAISNYIGKCKKIPQCCLLKRRDKIDEIFSAVSWKQMAAISIGIAYAKCLDDWLDEKNILTGIKLFLVKYISSKARRKQKEMFDLLKEGMDRIKNAEKTGCDLDRQSILTGKMIIDAIQANDKISLDNADIQYIMCLSKWLCLVDAIDDFEDDLKRKKYNPFLQSNYVIEKKDNLNEKEVFVATYYREIAQIYCELLDDMSSAVSKMNMQNNEREIINMMTYVKMPEMFNEVMQRRK